MVNEESDQEGEDEEEEEHEMTSSLSSDLSAYEGFNDKKDKEESLEIMSSAIN